MKLVLLASSVLLTGNYFSSPRAPQATPPPTVATYSALADSIIGLHHTEEQFVLAMLDGHYQGALAAKDQGRFEQAAAKSRR